MRVGFQEAFPPASEDAIQETERFLGAPLPDDFKAFLREHNGGYLEPNFLNEDVAVRYVYSAGPNDDPDIQSIEEAVATYGPEHEQLPGFAPVGEDDGGNLVMLNLDTEGDYGAVYFWGHDVSPPAEAYDRIADSFTALFEALRPDSEFPL